jgi:hypothetical protein
VSRSGGRSAALAAVFALALLAGCGGSDRAEKPAATPTATTHDTPKTGGPATSPEALEAKGYVVIPRTNVALRPPDRFVVDDSLPGLSRPDGHDYTSIVVEQRQTPYDDPDKAAGELAAGLKNDGPRIEWKSVERVTVDGRPAVAAVGTEKANGETYKKAFVGFPAEGFSVMLTATLEPDVPTSAADALAVLRDARWSTTTARGDVGFAVKPAKGYDKLATSSGIAYSRGKAKAGVPLFVGKAMNTATTVDENEWWEVGREAFAGITGDATVDTEQQVTIAGIPGRELIGSGTRNGRKSKTYVVVLFLDGRVLTLAGTFDPDRYPDQIRAFKSMAHSLRLRG